jgi:putative ABC transport system permease protein
VADLRPPTVRRADPRDARARLELRMLGSALARRPGSVLLAVAALAIGSSVAAALLHVSGDVSRKLTRELRALGPNLLVVPAAADAAGGAGGVGAPTLEVATARARLARAGLDGAPLLYVVATVDGRPVQVVGADLAAARRLHPGWRVSAGDDRALLGARLAHRLGLAPGARVALDLGRPGAPPARLELVVGATLDAGGPDGEAWWIPLADAQRLADLAGRASLVQARIPAGGDAAAAVAALESGGGLRALPLHALSDTEAGLLARMRRLMALVTIVAGVAAGLCAFGTLTDLAIARRRDIALLKALGAGRDAIVRQLVAESVVIGLAGGVCGWLIGVVFAEIIGQRVFGTAVAIGWGVPPAVIGLSTVIAALAGLGPIRLALAVEPATALRED